MSLFLYWPAKGPQAGEEAALVVVDAVEIPAQEVQGARSHHKAMGYCNNSIGTAAYLS